MSKIKSLIVCNILYFLSYGKQDNLISSIISNCIANERSAFYLGRINLVLPLSKKFVHTLAFALSWVPKNIHLYLDTMPFSDKQFWRIIFATRNLTRIKFSRCKFHDLRSIDNTVFLGILNFDTIDLSSWYFKNHDKTICCKENAESIISTLRNMFKSDDRLHSFQKKKLINSYDDEHIDSDSVTAIIRPHS